MFSTNVEKYDYKKEVIKLIEALPNDLFMKQLYTMIMWHRRRN